MANAVASLKEVLSLIILSPIDKIKAEQTENVNEVTKDVLPGYVNIKLKPSQF